MKSNSTKKSRRQDAARLRLAAASRVAAESIESRLLMSAVAYSYVTDLSTYNVSAGQTATVNVYLKEALNGNTSIINQ